MSEKNKVEMHSETDSHVGHNEEAAVTSQMSKLNIEVGVHQNIKENLYKNKENNPITENSYKGRRIVHRSRNFDREISHNKNGYVGSPHKRGNANTAEEPPNYTPPRHVLAELEAEGVFSLKKKSIRFPKAKYFCRLCDYHCDTVEICRRHVADTRHRHLKELKTLESSLRNLLPPTEAQNEVITELIESVAEKYGITDQELEERKLIKIELEKLLQEVVPGASIEISGSSLSKFAIKSSNLDLDIVVPEETKPSIGLLAVLKILEQNDKYSDVFNDLSSSYPCMTFVHKKSGVSVVVGVSCPASRSTNRLLGYYNTLDSRVKPLVTAFRYWGKLCQLDDQHRGTLSAHCFPLMGVHFLQHTSPPVLPSLHALHSEKLSDQFITPDEIDPPYKSQNTSSIGELWVELFKFYSLTFKMSAYVINIRSTELLTRTERTWGKRMAIEDPFQTRRNLTRTVSCPSVFDYIATRFKTTYRYFVIPQMKFGFLFKQLEKEDKLDRKDSYEDEDETEEDKENNGDEDDDILNGELEDEDDDEESTSVEDVDEIKDGSSVLNDFEEGLKLPLKNLEKNEVNISLTNVSDHSSIEENEFNFNINDVTDSLQIIPCKVAKILMRQVQKEHLHYSFAEVNFTGGKTVPLFCSACQKSGHTKASCEEHELPPLKPLPKLKQSYYDLLSSIFFQMKNECAPTPEEIKIRDYIVRELEEYIEQFFPGASLKLFGSSANGFGFGHSDLDICLTFKNHHTGEDIDHIKIIEEIAEKLKRFRQCRQVLAITTAKVPIVKFIIKRPLLEADLSLYNTLALQNTKLLRTYANMDHRVKILGYAMKYFAKLCDMGDASRGSLSSYAYILMVLHFLQQCQPPVLPVLQKLYNPKQPPPTFMIDGWNAWFYDDLTSIPKVWKDHGKNTARVGELWVHMLRYYTETFNWKDNVVTIRQLAPLTRLEKLWTTRCIAIEDPFDLSHNLGAGLSRKMNAFIMKAFIRGREMFGSGIEVPPMGYGYHSLVEYLFDTSQLTDGAPPNDRGCRWCGKIGHIVRDCPRKKQKKEKQKERKDTKKKTEKSPEKITEGKREKENGDVKTIQLGPEARDRMLERMGKGIIIVDLTESQNEILKKFLHNDSSRENLMMIGYRIYPFKMLKFLNFVKGIVAFRIPCKQDQEPMFMVSLINVPLDVKEINTYRSSLGDVLKGLKEFLGCCSEVEKDCVVDCSSSSVEIETCFHDKFINLLREKEESKVQQPKVFDFKSLTDEEFLEIQRSLCPPVPPPPSSVSKNIPSNEEYKSKPKTQKKNKRVKKKSEVDAGQHPIAAHSSFTESSTTRKSKQIPKTGAIVESQLFSAAETDKCKITAADNPKATKADNPNSTKGEKVYVQKGNRNPLKKVAKKPLLNEAASNNVNIENIKRLAPLPKKKQRNRRKLPMEGVPPTQSGIVDKKTVVCPLVPPPPGLM